MAAIDITGIGQAAEAAKGILGMIFPDKTEEEKAKLAASLALITGQLDINKAEAQSSDPLQHWRGGLGWVCVAGYAWNFVVQPAIIDWMAVFGGRVVTLHKLDMAELATITAGMLGLGTMHVVQQIRGAP